MIPALQKVGKRLKKELKGTGSDRFAVGERSTGKILLGMGMSPLICACSLLDKVVNLNM